MGLGFILTISVIVLVAIGGYTIKQREKAEIVKAKRRDQLQVEVEKLLKLKTELNDSIEKNRLRLEKQEAMYVERVCRLEQAAAQKQYQLDLKYREAEQAIRSKICSKEDEYQLFKNKTNEQCQEIEEHLAAMKARLDAQIEAEKKEQQLVEHQDFYKMSFSKDEIKDINYLYSIAENLKNPQILYKLIWTEYVQPEFKKLWSRIGFKEKTSGIYKITNLLNKKIYIGQSVDLQSRLQNHIKAGLGIDTVAHQKIHEAIQSDGLQNFTFEILKTCPKDQLNDYEKDFISTYHSNEYGYNVTGGGS